ncbi:MAG: class I SAM-dependent methyltransferase [Candidatus Bathyarchaeota archaeon]|nr:class I SAM-dependent methyltransferase [Candidatus Bathyarchaeota archaeon]
MQQWNKKRSTMQHYDQQAKIYDVQYVGEQNAKIENALNNITFHENDTVLDLGCGTGFLFNHIKDKVGLVVGTDLSAKALREAKKRTKNMSNIVLVCADADNTPFLDNSFDKVFAFTVIQNMPKPLQTLAEMKRVAKPQSIFVVTGLKKAFSTESFGQLLRHAGLHVCSLDANPQLKGIVVVCKNSN